VSMTWQAVFASPYTGGSADPQHSHSSMHIPYRNSKLTRILASSIGGNARTAVVTCVSAAASAAEPTRAALHFASQVGPGMSPITFHHDVARPGRWMRRVCTGTLAHCEQPVRERVARPGWRMRRVCAATLVHYEQPVRERV